MSHKSTSLNQGKFFNKKINSYKPLEKYESDILDVSDKQFPYYNNSSYKEGFDPVNEASDIIDEGVDEYIILTGYELQFNPDGVNIQRPKEDNKSDGGMEQKQSIFNYSDETFKDILKKAASDSNVYAVKIDKNSNQNKIYLYRKNNSDKIPHATGQNSAKIYPRVVPVSTTDSSSSADSVHLLLRPGTGEIPENFPLSYAGNDAIMRKVGTKAKKMDQLQKEFNIINVHTKKKPKNI